MLAQMPQRYQVRSLGGNNAEQETLLKYFQGKVPPTHNIDHLLYLFYVFSTDCINVVICILPSGPTTTQSSMTGGRHQFLLIADGCRAIRMACPGPPDFREMKING